MGTLHCMFCGGKNCKYENFTNWLSEKNSHIAIRGLYSSWVTDTIVATARPSSRIIEEYKIMDQLQSLNIKAIINLQQAGEHASCGDGIHDEGFSYQPEEFMNNNIYYYNFGWKDMTVPTLDLILNAAQVMHFTEKQGHKMMVHCHAGLGRTGLLIACYLVYRGYSVEEAITTVRIHRPNAIQTAKQEEFVSDFYHYVKELQVIFAIPKQHKKFSFEKSIKRQRRYLHGIEEQIIRFVPKVVYVICQKLHESFKYMVSDNKLYEHVDVSAKLEEAKSQREKLNNIKNQLNHDDWIFLQWFEHLKEPLISHSFTELIPNDIDSSTLKLMDQLSKPVIYTLDTILKVIKLYCTEISVNFQALYNKFSASVLGYSSIEIADHPSPTQIYSVTYLRGVDGLSKLFEYASHHWKPPTRRLPSKATAESNSEFAFKREAESLENLSAGL